MENKERNQGLKQNVVSICVFVTSMPFLLMLLVSKLCMMGFAYLFSLICKPMPYKSKDEWTITKKLIKIYDAIVTL